MKGKQFYVRFEPGEWEILCAKAAAAGLAGAREAQGSTLIRFLCGFGRASPGVKGSRPGWNRVRGLNKTTENVVHQSGEEKTKSFSRVTVTLYEDEIREIREGVHIPDDEASDSNLIRVRMGLQPLRRGSPLLIGTNKSSNGEL
jgi:hypothetical protein